ncbi:Ribokinase-like protein [Rhizopus microsporus var. microsporus]|uniref:Ribokinase-like protein n=1 Tax=Rhizopus microsporus var. microsporus TaxID=86635 RepID=A0A1X0R6D1_RHIZD|nr:Ribokinase-like protein [Rhizopus microsporus var. microsporus]
MLSRPLLVIGGVALDITSTVSPSVKSSVLYTSTPGKITQTLGGVGRNIAEAAMRTGARVRLVSVVGDDLAGINIYEGMKLLKMDTRHIQTLKGYNTAVYNALHSNTGQLVAAVADMDIFEHMDGVKVASIIQNEQPNLVCFDGNISSKPYSCIYLKKAFFEPTSVPKSLKLFNHHETLQVRSIRYISPNQFELDAMSQEVESTPELYKQIKSNNCIHIYDDLSPLATKTLPQAMCLSHFIPNVITKLGEEGCLYVGEAGIKYFPPETILPHEIKSVTGAGDCFVGTFIANLQKHPIDTHLDHIVQKSQLAAIRTLKSDKAVSVDINHDLMLN